MGLSQKRNALFESVRTSCHLSHNYPESKKCGGGTHLWLGLCLSNLQLPESVWIVARLSPGAQPSGHTQCLEWRWVGFELCQGLFELLSR